MPIVSNKINGDVVVRNTANQTYNFTDLALPVGENQNGTVSIVNAQVNVVGTGTAFTSKFANGDYVYVVGNSTFTEVARINQVVNATFMNIVGGFAVGAANTSTTYRQAERIEAVDIAKVKFALSSNSVVLRGSNTILNVFGTGNWNLNDDGMSLIEDRGGSVVVQISGGGTIMMTLSKKLSGPNGYGMEF